MTFVKMIFIKHFFHYFISNFVVLCLARSRPLKCLKISLIKLIITNNLILLTENWTMNRQNYFKRLINLYKYTAETGKCVKIFLLSTKSLFYLLLYIISTLYYNKFWLPYYGNCTICSKCNKVFQYLQDVSVKLSFPSRK